MKMLTDKIRMHIRENLLSYIILFILFSGGAVLGGYITRTYNTESIGVLSDFFKDLFELYKRESPDYNIIFKNTFIKCAGEIVFIWLMGFTVAGLPFIFYHTLKAGFMLGFVSTLLISFYGGKGIFISASLSLARCVIYIPLMFMVSVYGIALSLFLIRLLFGKIRYKINLKYSILNYFLVLVAAFVIIIIYSLSEAYLTSNLIQLAMQ